jgi:hypothetical protein
MSLREAAGILDKTCHFESSALESRVVSLIEDAEYLEAAAALMRQAEARLVESQG